MFYLEFGIFFIKMEFPSKTIEFLACVNSMLDNLKNFKCIMQFINFFNIVQIFDNLPHFSGCLSSAQIFHLVDKRRVNANLTVIPQHSQNTGLQTPKLIPHNLLMKV